jgi:hypothetical protein
MNEADEDAYLEEDLFIAPDLRLHKGKVTSF